MHDMTAKKAGAQMPYGHHPNFEMLHKLFPTRPSCGARRPRTCRCSRSNTATPAPAPTSASRTTGRPSTPSRSCRATASITTVPPVEVELFGTPLRRADRHRADGRAVAGVAGRRSDDGEAPRSARACPTRSASPAAPPSRRSRKPRPTCSGCSSTASGAERSRNRLRPDRGAPRPSTSRCWRSPSTCRCAPRARAKAMPGWRANSVPTRA